jgi:hypothetical protein
MRVTEKRMTRRPPIYYRLAEFELVLGILNDLDELSDEELQLKQKTEEIIEKIKMSPRRVKENF